MKTRLVRIGNSHGVRIPKPLIEEAGLEGEVELSVRQNSIVIRSASKPRAGWDKAFKAMAAQGDDALLDGDVQTSTEWDESEWSW